MCSYSFAVQHPSKLFEVFSIYLGKFSDSCDLRTCDFTKHCSVVDPSCSAENHWNSSSLMLTLCVYTIAFM